MTEEWIETNNSACKILRQVHDMLALASVPPRKTWVGLTTEEILGLQDFAYADDFEFVNHIEALLKEKNNG